MYIGKSQNVGKEGKDRGWDGCVWSYITKAARAECVCGACLCVRVWAQQKRLPTWKISEEQGGRTFPRTGMRAGMQAPFMEGRVPSCAKCRSSFGRDGGGVWQITVTEGGWGGSLSHNCGSCWCPRHSARISENKLSSQSKFFSKPPCLISPLGRCSTASQHLIRNSPSSHLNQSRVSMS